MPQRRLLPTKARPIRGKDESFTFRITPETRDAIRSSAEAAGHSMSGEAELLLQSALRARAAAANQIDDVFDLGWEDARRVIERADGAGPADSLEVYLAICDIIKGMLERLPAPETEAAPEPSKSDPKKAKPPRSAGKRLILGMEDETDSAGGEE